MGSEMCIRDSSHTVFQLTVESTLRAEHDARRAALAAAAAAADSGVDGVGDGGGGGGAVRCAVLTLVDLAGSERQAKTAAAGARLKEGCCINQSLHHLSVVISKLTAHGADAAGAHIPYRDSPLTKILQPALGGNARTALVCTVTLADEHAAETASTLKFAALAKHVTNRASVNEFLDDKSLIRRLRSEVAQLREQMARLDVSSGAGDVAPSALALSDALARAQDDLGAERAARAAKEGEYLSLIHI